MRDKKRIPEACPVKAAWTVEKYDFCFPVYSKTGRRAASGIVPNLSGRRIFGALYRIPEDLIYRERVRAGRISMDEIEGEGSNYDRTKISVVFDESGKAVRAVTYLPRPQDNPGYTDTEYAGYILTGLAEWNAPKDYVEYVEGIIVKALPRDQK